MIYPVVAAPTVRGGAQISLEPSAQMKFGYSERPQAIRYTRISKSCITVVYSTENQPVSSAAPCDC